MNRRSFISCLGLGASCLGLRGALPLTGAGTARVSSFAERLEPLGRILELPDSFVWCNTPIYGPDGLVHVFFSRWPSRYGMGGWIRACEIAHAVADTPAGPYRVLGTALAPRPGFFDASTCHNPHIQCLDGRYYLFYMGNRDGSTRTKRIGLAVSDSLNGPWVRSERPLLETGEEGAWDDHCTTNPAFVRLPDGSCRLYYKSWNTREYESQPKGVPIRGNRKYGLAIASRPEGPYLKVKENPVIDFSGKGDNRQLEDAFVWFEKGRYHLVARDMGFFDHSLGLLFESQDGLRWSDPEIAYHALSHYVQEAPGPAHLKRQGRLERPQLLMNDGVPTHLFGAAQGGREGASSGFVFRLR